MVLSRSATLAAIASTALFGAAACVAPTTSPEVPMLTGTVWELQQIQMSDGALLTANPPENYTAEFTPQGEVFVQADCNRAIGQFTEEADGRLSVQMGPTTMAACPEGSIGPQFLQALNNSNLFFFQDEDLFIDLAFDSGTMQFSSQPPPSLVGTQWKLQQIVFNDDTTLVADQPENYTVEFMDDGSLAVQADCNRGRGTFTTTDDRQLEIGPIATTLAACPEGSLGNDFTEALSNSAIYFFQGGDLYIDLAFGSGTMQLSAD
jgi:heat shock protein HslJ